MRSTWSISIEPRRYTRMPNVDVCFNLNPVHHWRMSRSSLTIARCVAGNSSRLTLSISTLSLFV